MGDFIIYATGAGLILWIFFQTVRIVPQREQYVVENLGKYQKTLSAGFHILIPFVQKVAYKHTLKEQTIDVPSQSCITADNISVEIDGILYLQVQDPYLASYGIQDYHYATSQLAQTTLRSEIGKIELDRTFEERTTINSQVVEAVDMASNPGASRSCVMKLKTSTRPQRCGMHLRNKCAQNGNDARLWQSPKASEKPELMSHKVSSKK